MITDNTAPTQLTSSRVHIAHTVLISDVRQTSKIMLKARSSVSWCASGVPREVGAIRLGSFTMIRLGRSGILSSLKPSEDSTLLEKTNSRSLLTIHASAAKAAGDSSRTSIFPSQMRARHVLFRYTEFSSAGDPMSTINQISLYSFARSSGCARPRTVGPLRCVLLVACRAETRARNSRGPRRITRRHYRRMVDQDAPQNCDMGF